MAVIRPRSISHQVLLVWEGFHMVKILVCTHIIYEIWFAIACGVMWTFHIGIKLKETLHRLPITNAPGLAAARRVIKSVPETPIFTLELAPERPIFHFAAAHTYQNVGWNWVPPPPQGGGGVEAWCRVKSSVFQQIEGVVTKLSLLRPWFAKRW